MRSSHTIYVHKGVPNRSRLRMSMDVRCQFGKPFNVNEAGDPRARSVPQRCSAQKLPDVLP